MLLLFVGIVTEVPASIARAPSRSSAPGVLPKAPVILVLTGLLAIAVVGFIVAMELARRRVPVEYRDREAGGRTLAGISGDLPVKLNSAGVIPFVLASWLLAVLVIIADIAGGFNEAWVNWITEHFAPGHAGYVVYIVLAVALLTLVYTAFVLDPQEAAEKLRRYGGVIPGVAPGEATAAHMDFVVSRTAALGAMSTLPFICVLPEVAVRLCPGTILFRRRVGAGGGRRRARHLCARSSGDRRIRLGGQGR